MNVMTVRKLQITKRITTNFVIPIWRRLHLKTLESLRKMGTTFGIFFRIKFTFLWHLSCRNAKTTGSLGRLAQLGLWKRAEQRFQSLFRQSFV